MDHTHELALEDWNRVLQINLTGTFLFCKTALPHLLETQGSITNTASTAAVAGIPYGAAYGASKGGVMALTRAHRGRVRQERSPSQLRVPRIGSNRHDLSLRLS